ncbi:hypothetical protein CQW23_14940 [Capsicum baccatum]|uniref:Uncharacterized protein n=1 Tax=Capsicum baccatum TaxID=33114 RepID=A0A2G2WKN6_CAPBA|nr:hypothetical protein CQW23_14940 [Capsicum baccatum]
MDEWIQNPTARTASDKILPYVDYATAPETLTKSKEVRYNLVDIVNQVITNVSNINFSPKVDPFYYNQSGPVPPILCNLFNLDLTSHNCGPAEVDLDNATQIIYARERRHRIHKKEPMYKLDGGVEVEWDKPTHEE